jgi:4-carboxymuconolactone decarboxylase
MSATDAAGATLSRLDEATRALVRVSAALAASDEDRVRSELQTAAKITPHPWIEELLLQTYLFAGFPRALNGMREWRRIARTVIPRAPAVVPSEARDPQFRRRGEETCAKVYGDMYERLRVNIRQLHPLLDDWMIEEGYGKVLGRPELDLPRRELCIVAACAATGQDRQLQSHLHGARNVGVDQDVISEALDALRDLIASPLYARARALWERIRS